MRRKISNKQLNDIAADLPDLTEQQRKFVEGVLMGKKSSDAYRAAYDCSGSQKNTIWANASRLANDANVSAWIAAARKAHEGNAVVTLENHLNELERLKEIALETGNVGAAVQAEQLRGKVAGHYTERLDLHIDDPLQSLREIAAFAPELAAKLAKEQNIAWDTETQH